MISNYLCEARPAQEADVFQHDCVVAYRCSCTTSYFDMHFAVVERFSSSSTCDSNAAQHVNNINVCSVATFLWGDNTEMCGFMSNWVVSHWKQDAEWHLLQRTCVILARAIARGKENQGVTFDLT